MVSSITAFDYLTAGVQGNKVILSGFTTGLGTRSEAEGRGRNLDWVEEVENNIEDLPVTAGDGQIRAQVRSRLGRYLPRAFSGNRAEIRIKVNRGDVTLVGLVDSELDKGVAETQTRTVPLVRSVTNQLVVRDRSN
jgi:osmotically-inducible protein OsmY